MKAMTNYHVFIFIITNSFFSNIIFFYSDMSILIMLGVLNSITSLEQTLIDVVSGGN